jgi:hypothetical protein
MKNIKLEIGMGATEVLYTDRHAFTIIEIINDRTVILQQDTATNTKPWPEQEYTYERNPNGEKVMVTLRINGKWVEKSKSVKDGRKFRIGDRNEYIDPCF